MGIFLSYRRGDSAGHAGRLADALEAAFGNEAVFQDVEAIAPGSDFVAAIEDALARCRVVLVLIGPDWADARTPEGERRLDDPADFVRLEVALALRRRVLVLPLLVGGARMPSETALPRDLQPLARRQAMELSDRRWAHDSQRVIDAIRDSGAAGPAHRRQAMVAVAAAVVVSGGGTLSWYLFRSRPPEIAGRWNLASGSHWVVVRKGAALHIEETHHDSRQVWKRGQGHLEGRDLVYALDYVFQPGVRDEGRVGPSDDGRVLTGSVTRLPGGHRESVTLTR